MAELNQIGCIKTPYKRLEDCPNNTQADGPECEVILDEEFAPIPLCLPLRQRWRQRAYPARLRSEMSWDRCPDPPILACCRFRGRQFKLS